MSAKKWFRDMAEGLRALSEIVPDDVADAPKPLKPAAPPPPASPLAVPLQQIHRRLIARATATPVPTARLIKAAGYKVNSWSRDQVTYLCRSGHLLRHPDGICLPRSQAAG